jgi:hypothetical protein
MSKLPVPDLRAGYRSVEQLQEVLGNIQEEFDNTLSRDGTSPNAMQAPIDMNDNPIVNLGAPVNPTDAVRLVDITGLENVDITTWSSIIGKPTSFPPSGHSHVVADITDFNPGVEALVGSSLVAGTNVTVTYNPTTGKTTVSSSGGGGGGSADWTDITNKPTTFTPSAHTQAFSTITDGQEAVEDIVANQIIGGTGITTSYNDSTGKLTINASGGGGGGASGIIDFADVFSGVGDGITNNDAAFAAAEASSYEQIYLPQGRFYTTTAIDSFTKSYWGPGKIYRGTAGAGAYPNFSRYSTEVHPTVDPNWPYGIAEDTEFGEVEWKVINQGMRKNFDRYLQHPGNPDGFPPYFWAPSTPHFLRFQNKGGWSGFSGATSTAITAGVSTTVGVVGGTTGWNIGDEIGFTDAMDGNVLETKVLTSVGGGTIGWSGTLANNYPAGSTLIHGYRTMNSAYITIANASGGGDTYIHTARMTVDYDGLASQTAFQHRATGGLFGGELILAKNGVYGTGWEGIYQDTGFDASCIGTVNSYVRTVDTGGYGNTWLHDYAKMDGGGSGFSTLGLKRIDGIYVAALGAKTGLDFTNSTFSLAAVALPIEAKIALDAQVVAPSGSNGNGFVATTDNNMYIRGSVVSGTKVIELNNGSYRLRLQANGGLTTNAQFTIGNSILASGTVTGNTLIANSGTVQLGSGGNTYFSFDGTTIRLYKNGSLVGSW